ncbi:MAG TPA: gluconate:H+ symporter [Chryseosolibacter sp.]|nr:gluconate:H+ symporter [Chryseosolibacter sp.]
MSILIVFICIGILVVLITRFKVNAFLAFLMISILAGLLLGIDAGQITGSIQKGIGHMLGSLVIVIVGGAMLGKLVAESGGAQRIASGMMYLFGERYIQWALMATGFIIGIPLFYNVGFVLVIPLIFSVVYRYKFPAVYIGLPMLASLSVTHGFLPPHPSPSYLVAQFGADMGQTLLYGMMVAVPTVIVAGPLFSRSLKSIHSELPKTFQPSSVPDDKLPGLWNSVLSSLLPVILLATTTVLKPYIPEEGFFNKAFVFLSNPDMVLLISLAIATYTLGLRMGMGMTKIMDIYGDAVKDIAMILLIMSGAGALKQVLMDSGVSAEIGVMLSGLDMHPLVLGWAIACVIRVCVGFATVAGLTAAGIIMPLMNRPDVNPNLMVLAIGAGSLMFSHVNDGGFWLFKEYFNLSIKDTLRSWSLMETIVAVVGIIGVMILNAFI